MRRIASLGSVIVFTIMAHTAAAAGDDFKETVSGLVKQYNDAFNKKDVAGLVGLYAPDGILVAADGHVYRGASDLKAYYEGGLKAGLKDHVADVTEAHSTGDSGYAFGTWGLSAPGKDGATAKLGGSWSGAYVKDGSGWHVKLLLASVPPPAPPAK